MHPVRLADYATKLSGSIGDCLQQLLGKKRNTLLSGRGGGSPCKQAYGFPTWALSSINVFLDLISLPYINRGVYRLGDLPTAQREEVMRLIQAAKDVDRWRDNKLFIFDDTLMHESINQTDQARYCLFVDMIRPTPFPAVMRATVYVTRLLTESFKFVYYQNWKVIQ